MLIEKLVTGLIVGTRYHFVGRCYDNEINESTRLQLCDLYKEDIKVEKSVSYC